ncbi:MAG: D-alanyl-D-alanine carboxypeptidase [Defluviitaleaceae bacterium]|nr:D-alanyl-D-alanine carboxypeptidase [Defluviitaleaceae bacterium]
MKRIIFGVLALLLLWPQGVEAAEKKPSVEAHGAILMDAASGRILWEKDAHKPMAMASTTKIMTAILALEQGKLDDIVTVSKQAAAAPRVKMYLQEGEQIVLSGLIHALMLQSSNDAAVAIAEHISGSVEAFCAAMTAKAHELGAINTIFETPNGLDAENHQSTAYDLAVITRYALSNTMFFEIINRPYWEVASSRATYSINNKNRLLNEFDGANGVKTGFTGKAGHCFVGAARRDDMQLISVVLASGWGDKGREQKWVDTKRILNFGFDNFANELIVEEGNTAGSMAIERSKTTQIEVYYGDSVIFPTSDDDRGNIDLVPFFPAAMKAPINENQPIGEGRIYIGGDYFTAIPILARESAARHDLKTSLEKVLREFLRLGSDADLEIVLPEF